MGTMLAVPALAAVLKPVLVQGHEDGQKGKARPGLVVRQPIDLRQDLRRGALFGGFLASGGLARLRIDPEDVLLPGDGIDHRDLVFRQEGVQFLAQPAEIPGLDLQDAVVLGPVDVRDVPADPHLLQALVRLEIVFQDTVQHAFGLRADTAVHLGLRCQRRFRPADRVLQAFVLLIHHDCTSLHASIYCTTDFGSIQFFLMEIAFYRRRRYNENNENQGDFRICFTFRMAQKKAYIKLAEEEFASACTDLNLYLKEAGRPPFFHHPEDTCRSAKEFLELMKKRPYEELVAFFGASYEEYEPESWPPAVADCIEVEK